MEELLSMQSLVASTQKLYENRETDRLSDFTIETRNGRKSKVHSLILFQGIELFRVDAHCAK